MKESLPSLLLDARRARRGGRDEVVRRQRRRLSEMVAFARERSPYYRELYRELPEGVEDAALLPVTDKKKLMGRFDEWITDREVSIADLRVFVDDPARIGERFLGRYTVATTSGTTGTPGIFLIDRRSLAVTSAMAARMLGDWLTPRDVLRILAGRGRMSMVMASGGHFASAVAAARLRKRRRGAVQILSVHKPLPELVQALNRFRPAVIAPYASIASLLAGEQEAGRLHIRPALLVLSAEGLPLEEYGRIARVFGAKVRHSYAATECAFLSYSCEEGWLHVNADWVICEPVDAEYRPTPPGEASHTVLITNLANRAQPILRYDLGDSVLQRPDPCPCGNPLPAIRVQGRAADALDFPGTRGELVKVPPLAFSADVPGVEQYQIVQTASASVRVRLRLASGADPERVWRAVHEQMARSLAGRDLGHVTVERAGEPPQQSSGGKFGRWFRSADEAAAGNVGIPSTGWISRQEGRCC